MTHSLTSWVFRNGGLGGNEKYRVGPETISILILSPKAILKLEEQT